MLLLVGTLMGTAEIADYLGVSRQRVQQLAGRPDFPKPVDTLAMGNVWARDDIERWATRHPRRRPVQSPDETES